MVFVLFFDSIGHFLAVFILFFTIGRNYPWTSVQIIAHCLHQVLGMHFFHSPVSCQSPAEPSFYPPKCALYLEPGLAYQFIELLFPTGQRPVFVRFFQDMVL